MFLFLAILILAFGAQIFLRPFSNRVIANIQIKRKYTNLKYIIIRILSKIHIFAITFYFSIFLIFSLLIYYSYQQYFIWFQTEPSKYFLPPYQSINYFIKYVGLRFFAPYAVSLSASILFLFTAKYLNKKYEERFFAPEEIYLGALALFLTGWPGALFYFIGLISIYLLVHVSCFMFHVSGRISLYYWWIPLAIFVIILNNWLVGLEWWKLLKI